MDSANPGGDAMAALSYTHGASPVPLLGETIGANLQRTVARHPDNEALVVVQQGDRAGIWAPNRHEWVIVQYATARIGAILVNINPAYKTSELEYALNQSGT